MPEVSWPCSEASKQAGEGGTQPPVQLVPGVKLPEHEEDIPLPSSVQVKTRSFRYFWFCVRLIIASEDNKLS